MSGSLLTGPAPSFTKTVTGYRKVQVLTGDTLERIAERELGDAAQWYDLAWLNNLSPPWITDDPTQAVAGSVLLSAQDTILVPSNAPPASGVAEAPNVFGRDCLLIQGQLSPDLNGDIAVVSDTANLDQALSMRLGTRPRELVYHPDYGNKAYLLLGRGGTPLADRLAAAWVGACLKADPRVSAVHNVVAQTTGDVLSVKALVTAVNGKRLPIGLPGTGT